MTIKPLGDKVVVKPAPREETTKAGIVLPETSDKDRPEKGEVVAVSEKAAKNLKVGDTVLFRKFGPDEFTLADETVLVMSENDIIGIVE